MSNGYDELISKMCELLPTGYARYEFEEHLSPVFGYDDGDVYYMFRAADGDGSEYYREHGGMCWLAQMLHEIGKNNLNAYLCSHLFVYVFIKEYWMFFPGHAELLKKWQKQAEDELRASGLKWHKRCSRFIVYPPVDYEKFGQLDPDSEEFAEVVVDTIDRSMKMVIVERWIVEKRECV